MFHAYAAQAAKQPLQPFSYEPAPLGDEQIEVKISHCGICHSDIHLIDNDWGISNYPLVPGHEILGTVSKVGKGVKRFREGQLVGVGWQSGSCGNCEWCNHSLENLCAGMKSTCVTGFGGYADFFRVDARFAVPLPEKIDLDSAAPLLCGGVTVYSPFRNYDVRPSMRVGVIGVGGLGHLALKYAAAFGCEVYAFSTSAGKEAESKQFGAHHFINTNDPDSVATVTNKLDFVLSTVSADIDWNPYFSALRPRGKLVIVGVAPKGVPAPSLPLILGEKVVGGSWIGSPFVIEEMLEFSQRHDIKPLIEEFPMSKVNDAIARVRSNKMRYRVVLKSDF
jgi:uncharacterized zinc-type alcohol dehydrogenase-like protein